MFITSEILTVREELKKQVLKQKDLNKQKQNDGAKIEARRLAAIYKQQKWAERVKASQKLCGVIYEALSNAAFDGENPKT